MGGQVNDVQHFQLSPRKLNFKRIHGNHIIEMINGGGFGNMVRFLLLELFTCRVPKTLGDLDTFFRSPSSFQHSNEPWCGRVSKVFMTSFQQRSNPFVVLFVFVQPFDRQDTMNYMTLFSLMHVSQKTP